MFNINQMILVLIADSVANMPHKAKLKKTLDSWRTGPSYHGTSEEWLWWLLYQIMPDFCACRWKMLSAVWHLCNVFVKMAASFTYFPVDLFVTNAIVTVLGPYCSQLLLVPGQCTVSFITYAGPIWSDKPSPSSEVITNNNDEKTQRIFALFCKWLLCVAWGHFLPISGVTSQPFPSLLPSDPYQARASGSSFGMGALPFTILAFSGQRWGCCACNGLMTITLIEAI